MHIVLTCINNFQEYILLNIKQLLRLGHTSIYIIANREFFEKFSAFSGNIQLIALEDLSDSYSYNMNTQLDNQFRGGFWALTSARFFYLYEFMRKYNIEDIIHLENDVLIYRNINVLDGMLDKTKIYLPFDTFTRNIASIMFIPTHGMLKDVLDRYDFSKNDMENFAIIQKQTGTIDNFPIFINTSSPEEQNSVECSTNSSPEYQFVTKNYPRFHMIFDAAAMGQYLGGVDPRNIPGNTCGFVNETCIIKYNQYQFIWNYIGDIKCPFIVVKDTSGNDCVYPIFNLHIHSKELENFI